ncbi:Crp/Fnr family transcriptional regulator [Motiliproteus sp. MSK22-1]|uniref:Crp/Fnr family transcriptional regulator n=1 Tax=Motiliproteus sp. MSK22-1 TaxID=1897630 RepID=UPI0009FA1BA4|nr:Crp/Fnr family transcriptional regulator [Motiliproteus sp. MSK22-1]
MTKRERGVWASAAGSRLSELQRSVALTYFKRHELFEVLTDSQLDILIDSVRQFDLQADDYLYHQHDHADSFFLLAEGQIKLSIIGVDGKQKVVEIVTPGKTMAEQVMFMPEQAYPLSAQAINNTTLYCISRNSCIQLIQENTEFCIRFLGKLCIRVDERLNEMISLTQETAGFRVAGYLVDLLPENSQDGYIIVLNTPKQVIASKLSIKPETFSRVMSSLTQKGIVRVKGREICVKDIEGLKAYK